MSNLFLFFLYTVLSYVVLYVCGWQEGQTDRVAGGTQVGAAGLVGEGGWALPFS